jgi:hypothetical protein
VITIKITAMSRISSRVITDRTMLFVPMLNSKRCFNTYAGVEVFESRGERSITPWLVLQAQGES